MKTYNPNKWTPEQVQDETIELNWQQQAELEEYQKAYLNFYEIDFYAKGYDVQQSFGKFEMAGYTISAQVFKQAGANHTALIVHGYYDHVGIYGSIIEFCLKQGWNVVAYDLPGHGLSSGARATIDDFQVYDQIFAYMVDNAKTHLTDRLSVFGQSTGGAIIINYLLTRQLSKEDSPFVNVVLKAPLVRPKGYWTAKIVHRLISPFKSYLKRGFAQNSNDDHFLAFLSEQDPLQPRHLSVEWVGAMKKWVKMIEAQPSIDVPITVVQGDDDDTVAWKHNMKVLRGKFTDKTLKMIAGGRHHLVNDDKDRRDQAYSWLNEIITK